MPTWRLRNFINSIDFDIDTGGEDSEEHLTGDACETALPVNEEDEEAIENVLNMSDLIIP